ncbi:MAG TPA: phosphoadenosine phosphosulfate reductase family protein [Herpetosiphonaceae bacterium]
MREINLPDDVRAVLAAGAALVVSISGGKDSQALLAALATAHREYSWPGPLVAVHAHLGRAEWPQTMEHCRRICAGAGVPLEIVERSTGGDLVDRWRERMHALAGTGKPFWSSAQQRYCTSDMKRGPINNLLRRYKLVVSAEGVRADESPNRARKPVAQIRTEITAAGLCARPVAESLAYRSFAQRLALTWYPLHDWSEADVWEACGTSLADLERRRALHAGGMEFHALDGWPGHPAYVFGNQRLSCALCILASRNDLQNGARHNPALYRELVAMEQQSGWTFRADLALSSLEV